jgi:hypothetical protein
MLTPDESAPTFPRPLDGFHQNGLAPRALLATAGPCAKAIVGAARRASNSGDAMVAIGLVRSGVR